MNLMFWKKKATTEDSADDAQEKPDDRTVPRESPGRESLNEEASEDAAADSANASPVRSRRGLLLGAVTGMLILAAAGLTIWKFFLPTHKQVIATVEAPTVVEPIPLPEKQLIKLPPIGIPQLRKVPSEDHQTDSEGLKKKNDALQTQIQALKVEPAQVQSPPSASRQAEIEILKKHNSELQAQVGRLKAELPQLEKAQAEQHQASIDALTKKTNELQAQLEALKKKQQQPSVPPTGQALVKGRPPARTGDMAVGNKNPKATAMTLKEVIDAMNAGSGSPPNKAAQ